MASLFPSLLIVCFGSPRWAVYYQMLYSNELLNLAAGDFKSQDGHYRVTGVVACYCNNI